MPPFSQTFCMEVRKHQAPKGALILGLRVAIWHFLSWSESTERQKVHQDIAFLKRKFPGVRVSESTEHQKVH